MKQFDFYHPFWMSFYSRALYRDVVEHWRGIGLATLLAVTFFSSILASMLFHERIILPFIEQRAPELIEQMPVIDVQGGIAKTEETKRFEIFGQVEGEKKLILVVDTSVIDIPEDLAGADLAFIGSSSYRFKFEIPDIGSIDETVQFVHSGDARLDRDFWYEYMSKMELPFAIMAGFIHFFILSGYRLLQVLIFSLGTFTIIKVHRIKLNALSAVRLTMIACTPSFLLDTLLSFYEVTHPAAQFFILLLTGGYLVFAINQVANKSPQDNVPKEGDREN
ncbi:MAG: DUF1189 family protein [Verrucomicrobiota bacterium]